MKKIVYFFLLIPLSALAQQPESSGSSTVGNLFIWALLIGIGYWIYTNNKKNKERIAEAARKKREYDEQLERQYKDALKGSNKALALDLGRQYYSNMRGGEKLTIYDEQALTNDLSTMKG